MKTFTFKSFFVATLLMCLGTSQSWASVFNTYSKAEVCAQTGDGKVFVTDNSSKKPQDTEYRTTSNASHSSILASHTYYIFAKADEGSVFAGWYANEALSGAPSSNNLASSFTVYTNQRSESSAPVGHRYAKFQTKQEVLEANGYSNEIIPFLLNSAKVKQAKTVADLNGLKVATLDEENNEETQPKGAFDAVLVSRSFSANRWNTFCVPFNMKTSDLVAALGGESNGVMIKALVSATQSASGNYSMQFDNPGDQINAGQGYIVWVNNAIAKADLVLGGADANVAANTPEAVDGVTFQGTYFNTTVAPNAGNYIISNNNFYYVDNDFPIKGFRAYFNTPESTANALCATFDDENVTGISFVNENEDENGNDNLYNIAGQRVNENAKGIIIKNGKKYLVK